jgi:hypothetical protein
MLELRQSFIALIHKMALLSAQSAGTVEGIRFMKPDTFAYFLAFVTGK